MPKLTSVTAADGDWGALLHLFPTVEHYLAALPPEPTTAEDPSVATARAALERSIADTLAPAAVTGAYLQKQLADVLRLLPTGCASLDDLLMGGLRDTQLTEVVGESCSGKSQLCMTIAAKTACRGEVVLYIDTTNAFSAERVAAMVEDPRLRQASAGKAPVPVSAVLRSIIVARPHSAHELLALLDQAAVKMARNQDPSARVCLIIVDSIAAVVSPILGGQQQSQGHALMMSIARALRQLANQFSLAVLTTNHMVSSGQGAASGGAPKPALGEYWRNQAHVRLQLSQQDDGSRTVTLVASTLHPVGASRPFRIDVLGVQDMAVPPGRLQER